MENQFPPPQLPPGHLGAQGYPQYPHAPLYYPPPYPYMPPPFPYGPGYQNTPPTPMPMVAQAGPGSGGTRVRSTGSTAPSREHPNPKTGDDEFGFQVEVIDNRIKEEFTGTTDMAFDDFKRLVRESIANSPDEIQLVCKVLGERPVRVNNEEIFKNILGVIRQKAKNPRRKIAVTLEVKNGAPRAKPAPKKKRSREDDIPPPTPTELIPQVRAFKQLDQATRCEKHRGHCHVDKDINNVEVHRRLDHALMNKWAAQMARGKVGWRRPPTYLDEFQGEWGHCVDLDKDSVVTTEATPLPGPFVPFPSLDISKLIWGTSPLAKISSW
ncbi:hypothetical protein BDN72DRAFT_907365 [Pluteus cervinus]|uniref:Uncharacterized protein n=1 Tax=Pluteus cervinus TaxID=181527 RepID=A0ACD2ZXJ2_9AGAR|nr:hypothetical protein BDN72DRAFT_907365 [Pluteus cervinus]